MKKDSINQMNKKNVILKICEECFCNNRYFIITKKTIELTKKI